MNKINSVLSAIGGYCVTLLGGIDSQLQALLVIMVLDFLTGLGTAFLGRSGKSASGFLSSKAAGAGILKKVAYLVCVIVAVLLENTTGLSFIREVVIVSFVITECLSVLENCTRLGIKAPDVLYRILDVLKKKTEEGENERK